MKTYIITFEPYQGDSKLLVSTTDINKANKVFIKFGTKDSGSLEYYETDEKLQESSCLGNKEFGINPFNELNSSEEMHCLNF